MPSHPLFFRIRHDRRLSAVAFAVSVFLGSLVAAVPLRSAEISVFAAASLTDSLKTIAAAYETKTGDQLVLNFGASSTLARQIEEGAPADIFFSADDAKMDALEKAGRILQSTRRSRLSNRLVIIVAADSSLAVASPAALAAPEIKRIALADPKAVPAGIYARTYLEKIRLWPALQPKIVPTENVRAALAAVESGDADAGMVYKTDAAISKKVKVAYEVPPSETPAIDYPMALVTDSKQPEAAKRFLDYLESAAAAQVFEQFGFMVRP